jgi:hypothetical protein
MMRVFWNTFFSVVERGRRKRYFVEGEFPFDGQLRGFCRLLLILHQDSQNSLKVPSCEIFDLSDFHYFYTIVTSLYFSPKVINPERLYGVT